MYFKVDRKILKKALVLLKQKRKKYYDNNAMVTVVDGIVYGGEYLTLSADYINKIEFCLYKTKLEEFYIDFDFAQEIRPALLTKENKSK